MKQLKLNPPLLILTMGYPGSGKTFFSRQFAEQYDIPRLSEDIIRFELFEQPQYNHDEAEIIDRVLKYMLSEMVKTQQTVIVDGLFLKKSDRESIKKLAKTAGYQMLIVWLQTDLQTSAHRAANRDRRNPDSKYSFNMNQMIFDKIKATLHRPDSKDETLVISGKHAYRSQSLSVLRKIAGIYAEQATDTKPSFGQNRLIKQRNSQLIQ